MMREKKKTSSDYASVIFSKNAGFQLTTLLKDKLLHRHFSRILAT